VKCNIKVLIVGINGFLGKELAKFFEGKSIEVFGTTHTLSVSTNIFQFKLGDTIDSKILLNNFSHVIYLAHSSTSETEKLINWYKKTFITFKESGVRQIYISSYSAHKHAMSNYGKSKYQIERFFLENNEYSITPGLIIGRGGLFNKIANFVNKYPIIVVPISSKENLIPVISIEKLCDVIFDVITKNFVRKNYNIYSHMMRLEDLIKVIIKTNKEKKYLFRINGTFILYLMKFIENIGIKLPVSSDNLNGFLANQKYSAKSDILEFGDDLSIELIIKKAI